MALQPTTLDRRAAFSRDLVRIAAILAAVIVLLVVATVVFGFQLTGPSYELTSDPAGLALPF